MELDLQIAERGPGAADPAEEIMELVHQPDQPDKRIISSDADVYLAEGHLVFVKDNCRPTDVEASFFLHAEPVDNEDLPGDRRPYGFENMNIRGVRRPYGFENMNIRGVSMKISDRQCAFTGELPDYPVRLIRVGQYVPGAGELWTEEFEMEKATDLDAGGSLKAVRSAFRRLFDEDSRDE